MFELGADGPLTIVAGIDGSDSSMRAAAYASGLARRQRARLALVYIQPMPATANAMAGAGVVMVGREIADDLRRQIDQALERLPEDSRPTWDFITESGDPDRGLVAGGHRVKADAV